MTGHTDYHVRSAEARDTEGLAEMRRLLQGHLHVSNPHIWSLAPEWTANLNSKYLAHLQDPERRIVVVEDGDGMLVGMAMAHIGRRSDLVPSVFGQIDDVWVAPKHRRRGLCQAMLRALLQFFETAGIEAVSLNYVVGNREAEAAWGRSGFHPCLVFAASTIDQVRAKLKG